MTAPSSRAAPSCYPAPMTPHASPPDEPVLLALVDRIVAVYQPEVETLFGSRARGDARPDSDYDFADLTTDTARRQK